MTQLDQIREAVGHGTTFQSLLYKGTEGSGRIPINFNVWHKIGFYLLYHFVHKE